MSRKKSLSGFFPDLQGKIKGIRGELTQTEFGKIIGVTQGTVWKYETGRIPDKETLQKIADYGEVTIEWLLRVDEKPAPQFLEEVQEKSTTRPSALNFETLARAIFLARQFTKRKPHLLSDFGEAQLAAYLYEYLDSEKKDPAAVVIQRLADLIRKQEG
jgi:transcriptional regulator with XRE-family HTH domain